MLDEKIHSFSQMDSLVKNKQYYKFCFYGFLKNLRFFDAFFILFLVGKGLSYTEIGVLYAVREIAINIFEVPSGVVADTMGRRKSLIGSLLAYIASFVVFFLSGNFWLFMIAFVFYGIGDAFRTGTHKGIIMDYLKIQGWENQKINYYGHTRSWSQMGSAISSLIAGFIVFYSGSYQNVFLYSIVPYLLNVILISTYPKELDLVSSKKEGRNFAGFVFIIKSLLHILKRRVVIKIVNTTALHTAFLQAVKDYIQPLLVSVALTIPVLMNSEQEKKNGAIIGVIYFFIYMATSLASKYSSKALIKKGLDIPFITLIAGFLLGFITGLFYRMEFWYISMIAFIGIFIIENFRKPILTGYISDNVPNEILASVISAQSLLKTIFAAIIALVFGVLADHLGIGFAFMITSGFLILFSFVIYYLKRIQKKLN